MTNKYSYINKNSNQREHIVLARKALGRRLPSGAEVHHVDGNSYNNAPENLVICPDRAYHKLLHQRTDAYNACGNANARKCVFCGEYSLINEMGGTARSGYYHRNCHNSYKKDRIKRRHNLLKTGDNDD